jgi:curved DNA-binding protein CbpA
MAEIKWRDLSSTDNQAKRQFFRWTEIQPRPSLYDLLEVSSTASLEVIKAAYRVLMEKHHPDKNPGHRRSWAEEISRELNHAYAVLSNPQKRREYDRDHGTHRRA